MRTTHLSAIGLACGLSAAAIAQTPAPAAGPLILTLPASTRAAALGDAWVVGREDFVIFYNPAQVNATTGASLRLAAYGPDAHTVSLAAGQTVGRFNFGWGAQLLDARVPSTARYPYTATDLFSRGSRDLLSLVASFAGNMSYKSTRIGLGAKYATDRVENQSTLVGPRPDDARILFDVGASRALLRGTIAASVMNVPPVNGMRMARRESIGYSRSLSTDQVDFAANAMVTHRDGWFGGGGGIEASYGWIEGWSATLRAGGRRPEWRNESPVSFGFGMVGDRLVLDYALKPMKGTSAIHDITIRWR